jgi:hypothetical protein
MRLYSIDEDLKFEADASMNLEFQILDPNAFSLEEATSQLQEIQIRLYHLEDTGWQQRGQLSEVFLS